MFAGNGTKRYWQLIEVADMRDVDGQLTQDQVQLLALHQSQGQFELTAMQPQVQIDRVMLLVLLAPQAQVAAVRFIGQPVGPIRACDDLFELGGAFPRGIETADDRAHARSGDRVNRDMQSLQLTQNADVRGAAGTATAQHQTYSWSVWWHSTRNRRRFLCSDVGGHRQNGSKDSWMPARKPGDSWSETHIYCPVLLRSHYAAIFD